MFRPIRGSSRLSRELKFLGELPKGSKSVPSKFKLFANSRNTILATKNLKIWIFSRNADIRTPGMFRPIRGTSSLSRGLKFSGELPKGLKSVP